MKQVSVSVLMTVYNREKYLEEAIQSVLASEFEDYEFIIVDDCSTDHSPEIARSFAQKDSRIRFYQNEKNLGDYPNRNRAASHAIGRYLKYVDSDDKIYPHCLSRMVEAMEQFPEASLGLCQQIEDETQHPVLLSPREAYQRSFLEKARNVLGNSPLSVIIRRSSFEKRGGFSGKNYIGDGELWLKLAAFSPLVLIEEGLTWWRAHGDQEFIKAQDGTQAIQGYLKDIAALNQSYCPLSHKEVEIALINSKRRHSRYILRLYQSGSIKMARQIMRGSQIHFLDLIKAFF